MRIKLVRITRSRKGHAIRVEQTIEADAPTIGRGAQCAIHLPDPRVAYEHAIVIVQAGTHRIAGLGGASLAIGGRLAADIALTPGSRFEIGPYQFGVEPPAAGCDLSLSYELTRPLPDEISEIVAGSRFTLAAEGASRRALGWGMAAVVTIVFLLAPVINAYMPMLRALTAVLAISPDLAWNPGPLSSGHAALHYNCGACHATPFVRVRDKSCLACHKGMPGHVHERSLQARLFGGTRCAECHRDHRGADAPLRTDAGLCLACHANLKGIHAETGIADVGDFAKAHPEFRPTLWRGPGPQDVVRVEAVGSGAFRGKVQSEVSPRHAPQAGHQDPGRTRHHGLRQLPRAGRRAGVPSSRSR